MSNDRFAALLVELGEEPEKKLSAKKTATAQKKDPNAEPVYSWAFSKTDTYMKTLLEHEREEIRWVAEARLGVKSTINESRTARFLDMGANGRRLPVYNKHCGAHTGRWSGSDKANFQNLERTDEANTEKGVLRQALLAPEGQTLVVADSGQIEARMIGWIAGAQKLLSTFRRNDTEGGDFYSDVGTEYFGRPVSKKETPRDRQVAKAMALGLGFQMGAVNFAVQLQKGMLGMAPIQFTMDDVIKLGVDVEDVLRDKYALKRLKDVPTRLDFRDLVIHYAVAAEYVRLYREKNPEIVQLWATCEEAIEAMAEGREMRFGPCGSFRTVKNGLVLPSGRKLHYPELRQNKDGWTYRGGRGKGDKARVHIYGGKLTENVVQATARDVVAEQVLWMHAEGLKSVSTTHDEAINAVPESDGPTALETMLRIMRTAPAWAEGLPLNAEGGFSRSYGEAK